MRWIAFVDFVRKVFLLDCLRWYSLEIWGHLQEFDINEGAFARRWMEG